MTTVFDRASRMASCVLAIQLMFVASAMVSTTVAAAEAPMRFEIAAGNALDSLSQFSRQSGLQMLFIKNQVAGYSTRALAGEFEAKEGLTRMLEGTGLKYEFVNDTTVTVVPVAAGKTSAQGSGRDAIDMALAQGAGRSGATSAVESRADGSRNTESESSGAGSSSQTNEHGLQEIVVTAQKRTERLQDVPMSISALSAQDIEHRGLVDRNDFLRSLPSVNFIDNGPGMNTLVIRGAYGDAFNTGPTVGVYFADVPLTGHALGSTTDVVLTDIERVEVLRGPQGTLYGSNSLSGTLRYIPRAPDLQSFSANVEGGYSFTGRDGGGNTQLQGIVNIPIVTDTLAVRALVYSHKSEGFYTNNAGSDPAFQTVAARFGAQNLAINQDHVGDSSYVGGRASVLWRPMDRLGITLTYLQQNTAQEDRPFEQMQYGPYQRSDYQHGGPGANRDALEIDLRALNLVGELDLGWGSLLSSTSSIDQEWVRIWDIAAFYPAQGNPPITQLSFADAKMLAQEVRLSSSFGGVFEFIAGLYYEDSDVPYRQPTFYVGDPALNPFAAMQMWDSYNNREVTQRAVFGEMSYKITDRLKATVGGRAFEYDSRFFSSNFNSVVIANATSDTSTEESGNTFRAGLEFKPADSSLVYANWSQGFRLGRPLRTSSIAANCDLNNDGFLDGTSIPSNLDNVSSDSLESYEVGGKMAMMNGRATMNVSAYTNKWKDIPVNIFPPGCITSTIINGGSARARGVEAEGNFRVTRALQLGVAAGYVSSELTANSSAGNDGDRMNYTPELSGSVSAEYAFTIAGRESFIRSDYTYFGNYYIGTGERGAKVPGHGLVDLNAGMDFERLQLQLKVSNVLGSDAFTTIAGTFNFPAGYALRVRPRTVGMNLSYQF